jgi:hypothetical protein
MSGATIIYRQAAAAVNPSAAGWKGRVVVENGVALECALSGAAAGTEADRPLGIVVSAENRLGGRVAICMHGICTGLVGGVALTKGAQTTVASDINGALVTSVPGAAVWTVGAWIPEAETTAAIGADARIFVNIAIDNT